MRASTSAQRPTAILIEEHDLILRVLDCLEALVHRARGSESFPVPVAQDVLVFLSEFADRKHHGKEEDCLFPKMIERGIPRQVGPIAVMLAEHEEGRSAIARMRAALPDCAKGERAGRELFAAMGSTYVTLLREHILKENEVLFPMADSVFREEDQALVLAAFRRVESGDPSRGDPTRYAALAADIAGRLGVTPRPREHHHGGGSCCGGH